MARLTKWDSVEILDNEEVISSYLNDAVETGDKDFIINCLDKVLRARAINRIAADTGIDRDKVYKIFAESAKTTRTTVIKVAKAVIGAPVAVS